MRPVPVTSGEKNKEAEVVASLFGLLAGLWI